MPLGPREAAERLLAGEVIAFPTETVWGLGALPGYHEKIFKIKGRPPEKPLTAFPRSKEELARLLAPPDELMALVPGPITLVGRPKASFPYSAPDGTLGARIPTHPEVHRLLELLPAPMLTTSANPSGMPPARARGQVMAYFPEIPTLVGESMGQDPSTVLRFDSSPPVVLRPGPIPITRLERVLGRAVKAVWIRVLFVCTGGSERSPYAATATSQRFGRAVRVSYAGITWPQEDLEVQLAKADAVFPMEEEHLEAIEALGYGDRVVAVLEVPDPQGLPDIVQRRIMMYLDDKLERVVWPWIEARLWEP